MRTLALLAIGVLAAGCAATQFTRVPDEALALGKTRQAEIRTRLGPPFREMVIRRHGVPVRVASYSEAGDPDEAAAPGATPARVQNFYFAGERLVGYEFVSSFREDSTDFELGRAAGIRKGVTTRARVLYMLGAPSGRYIFPMTRRAGQEALVYVYSHIASQEVYRKSLVVSFDDRGRVSEVEAAGSGSSAF